MNYQIKMSRRLQQIDAMIGQSYQHIWDCCCDHGFLGLSLLKRQAADTVHFVDIVPALLTQLEADLKNHYGQAQNRSSWKVHCSDVSNLPLASVSKNPESDNHLIIIAGVGGELTIKLMKAILSQFGHYPLAFILCPVHHNYKVREFLISRQLGLIAESLIIENKRGYEILHVALNTAEPISIVGSKMWDFSQKEHIHYLQKSIKHYQRIAKNPLQDVQGIINQYQRLLAPIDSAY
ncbi:SAM-dependent methyltransferase [Psychromonas sp. MB-3u-54]|uniref:tRNA (adenine(22)-N(1))-methyltransferase n=1 Tax=Psychromonas sp. MB-3u-54 TaxID=2058319 RepID=UPI000C336F2F|nr:tRNA (adenine(22)-N(1))-methyltransferase TrmK [Psychromonas sp. MB-3u-54]PKH04438.1 SAM-dependent methyltransferase [Psychromonas sp. MB-3u-54]